MFASSYWMANNTTRFLLRHLRSSTADPQVHRAHEWTYAQHGQLPAATLQSFRRTCSHKEPLWPGRMSARDVTAGSHVQKREFRSRSTISITLSFKGSGGSQYLVSVWALSARVLCRQRSGSVASHNEVKFQLAV